jgi:signal transduction histidine kinase
MVHLQEADAGGAGAAGSAGDEALDAAIEDAATGDAGTEAAAADYAGGLTRYVRTRSEGALYAASVLSHRFIRAELGPEEIIAIHAEALTSALAGLSYRDQARAATDALQFLLEVMIAYGVNHREYLELRVQEHLRQAEAARARADEAERAMRERARLLQVLAHELRTPLAAVKGNLQLAQRALGRGQFDSLERLAAQALEAVNRLTRMTSDLVLAGRGEAAPEVMSPQDLRAVAAQAHAWIVAAGDAAAKDVVLVAEVDGGPLPVLGDPDALASVVVNLLSNAVRYTPAGGRVTLSCGADGGAAWVEVADTGIGMPPEVQARIFDQFYRAPEALAADGRGLGLGLALVRQLVTAHGGRVDVRSAPGAGSTFRAVLPLCEEPAPPAGPPDEDAPDAGGPAGGADRDSERGGRS